jgi:hypothetical protein
MSHKMGVPIETQLLINNKLVPASDNATFDLFSPHTGELVAKGICAPQSNELLTYTDYSP